MPDIFISPKDAAAPTTTASTLTTPPIKAMPFFATSFKHPSGITFVNQDPDETIVLFLRRDFITNFLWLFTAVILFLIPAILSFLNLTFSITSFSLPQNFQTVLLMFYYLVVSGYVLFHFISWFYNISIVTNKEVIDIDYENLVSKNVSQATFEAIRDTKYKQGGFLQSFFNYGLVTIVTDGPQGDIFLQSIPNPGEVTGIIQDLKEAYTHH